MVVVLADREDPSPGRRGQLEGGHAVIGQGGQVDDRGVAPGQARTEPVERRNANWFGADGLHGPRQPVGPDEVLGQDDDAHGHDEARSIEEARWWNTSRAVTTPVGRPFSRIGMWRNPPTAILWMATAIGSSWRSTTGSGVMKSRT